MKASKYLITALVVLAVMFIVNKVTFLKNIVNS